MRCSRHVVSGGKSKSAYRVLVGRHKKCRLLGKARLWWENNIKIYLEKYDRVAVVDCIGLE
jgi:hypothetical protein